MKNYKLRKILWLVLLVLFSLALVGDIANVLLLPEQQSFSPMGAMPSFGGSSEDGESSMPDFSSLPDFDSSERPEMPSFGGSSEDGESSMPDFSSLPDFGSGESRTGASSPLSLLYTLKTYAIPVGIGCALGILLCIWRLVALRKHKPLEAEVEDAAPAEEEEDEKPRKSGTWKTVVALVLILGFGVSLFTKGGSSDNSGVEVVSETLSTQVSNGSLDMVLLSGGSLSESESESLSYAGNVRLLSWEVGENEVVAKGQVLATVDKNSVLSAISELKETMDSLDEALEDSRSDSFSSTISAPIAGRIVAIFASAGDSVQDVVGENGALMLLSLDGRLSLDIDAGELAVGDGVNLRRSDGSVLSAQVSELMEGIATVTVGDSLCDYGESVTVLSLTGEELGAGELGVHRCMGITGIGGTVSSISVKPGASVSANQTLMTIIDTDYTGEYERLLQKRQKLEAQVEALYALYTGGTLTAPETGYVSNLNTSVLGLAEASSQGSGMSFPFGLSSRSSASQVSLLSSLRSVSAEPALLSAAPGEGEGGGMPQQEESSYSLVGTVISLDMQTGTLNLSLLSGGTLSLSLVELAQVCDTDVLTSLSVGNLLVLSYREDDTLLSCTAYAQLSASDTPGGSHSSGGSYSFSVSGTASTTEESYSVKETELCSLNVFNKVDIELDIDELDIGSLAVGQSVEVTLDALEAQVFEASVSEINPNGSNSGGNTKYTVTVTMPRTGEMLSGMNATVRFPLSTHESLLLLPAEAIQEDASGVYVYTGYNEKDGSLSGRVDITTGLSDGTMVEIRSGLAEGDTVWYSYADTLKYTFTR